jgi:preprotein translocase subunit SecG
MIHTILNVFYVLIAVSIVVLILLQRGAGAQAGSGFGAGASATVFGSRGSANFLSSATKWLAVAFFGLNLFMAWQAGQAARLSGASTDTDAGVMGEAPAKGAPEGLPAAPAPLPAAPAPAPAAAAPVIAPATPAAVPTATPVTPAPETPAPADKGH